MSTATAPVSAPLIAPALSNSLEPAPLRPLWGDLGKRSDSSQRWLWQGYLAHGAVTLLTSQWKTGKTTLLSVLLDKLGSGGALAGQSVQPGRAFILSEESLDQWRGRHERFSAWPHVGLECRPLRTSPSLAQWHWLIEQMVRLLRDQNVDLVVIDSLAMFLPRGSESHLDKILDALRPLERLTESARPCCCCTIRARGSRWPGKRRGSGALCSYADILMELHHAVRKGMEDRRRRLLAWSRHDETPREMVLELAEDGRDYRLVENCDEEYERSCEILLGVLQIADNKLTRQQILAAWPERRPPHEATLYRWLERSVERRLILQEGVGRRNDPFRYWLHGRDVSWNPDPLEEMGLIPPELMRFR